MSTLYRHYSTSLSSHSTAPYTNCWICYILPTSQNRHQNRNLILKLEQMKTWFRFTLILLKLHKLTIFMKSIEIAATRWHILKVKCTTFDFG